MKGNILISLGLAVVAVLFGLVLYTLFLHTFGEVYHHDTVREMGTTLGCGCDLSSDTSDASSVGRSDDWDLCPAATDLAPTKSPTRSLVEAFKATQAAKGNCNGVEATPTPTPISTCGETVSPTPERTDVPTDTPEPTHEVSPTPTVTDVPPTSTPVPTETVVPEPTNTPKVNCNKGGGNDGEGCDPGNNPDKGHDDEDQGHPHKGEGQNHRKKNSGSSNFVPPDGWWIRRQWRTVYA